MVKDETKDVLLAVIREQFLRLANYETQRSTISNLIVIVAAAILGFVTFDKELTIADLPLTILLIFIGVFGAGFSLKYHERIVHQDTRIRKVLDELDAVYFDSSLIRRLFEKADQEHASAFPMFQGGGLSWVKVSRLWIMFHLSLALLGFILTVLIYFI